MIDHTKIMITIAGGYDMVYKLVRVKTECKKCGKIVNVETDYLSEAQAKSLHKCKGKGK